jgi:TPR repeat protein
MYENGRGVPVDLKEAQAQYRKACDAKDDEWACRRLGAMPERGKTPPGDTGSAQGPSHKARDGGSEDVGSK